MAIVVMSWCQVVCVMVVASSSGCHIASCNMAPLVSMKRLEGVLCLLTWAGHDLAAIIIIIELWQVLNGGGGQVASSIVVVGRKKQ